MSAALGIIQAVETAGGRFLIDGDRLGVVPKAVADPMGGELRLHKLEIIDLLALRSLIPDGALLVSWEPLLPPVVLSECETVTDVGLFIATTLRQLNHRLNGRLWLAGNWPVSVLLNRLSAVGCVVALVGWEGSPARSCAFVAH
jgi:hypothetical protein